MALAGEGVQPVGQTACAEGGRERIAVTVNTTRALAPFFHEDNKTATACPDFGGCYPRTRRWVARGRSAPCAVALHLSPNGTIRVCAVLAPLRRASRAAA
eukprot:scaffold53744_cov84-Phaeocystis_antarctica.AAC.1